MFRSRSGRGVSNLVSVYIVGSIYKLREFATLQFNSNGNGERDRWTGQATTRVAAHRPTATRSCRCPVARDERGPRREGRQRHAPDKDPAPRPAKDAPRPPRPRPAVDGLETLVAAGGAIVDAASRGSS